MLNPRYANIYDQPVRQRECSEWDMDVNALYYSLNELDLNRDDNAAEEFKGADSDSEEEDYEEDYINEIRQRNPDRQLLENFINHVLDEDQRAALRHRDCFWCKKSRHWWINCKARKLYNQQKFTRNVPKVNKSRNKSKFSKGPRKPNVYKKTKQPFVKKPVVDPNAMVYNLEEEDNELEQFQEYLNNGNF
jgi:G3E family GTPase